MAGVREAVSVRVVRRGSRRGDPDMHIYIECIFI